MKILYPFDNPEKALNPYVLTIVQGLKKNSSDLEIVCSIAEFWTTNDIFDIVHIMWPDMLLKEHFRKKYSFKNLYDRLRWFISQGCQIVSTCHNLLPHYNSDEDYRKAYEVVYSNSKLIIHLGTYSLQLFEKQYPNVKHVEIPHHVYDQIYTYIPSKAEARKKLGLSMNKKYVLCFGMFRSDEERDMIKNLSKQLQGYGIEIIAPTFSYVARRKNMLAEFGRLLKYFRLSLCYPHIKKHIGLVSNNMLPYYCCACEVALLQRVNILNSGNVPLNFYFGNVVVGPNVGNVGCILNKTNNFTFDIHDIHGTLLKSVLEAFEMVDSGLGKHNRVIALETLNTNQICKKLLNCYNEIVKS